jgi:hypothetical protein
MESGKDRILMLRYRVREDHRQTVKGVEKFVPAGAVVTPIQEVIHYQKRNHRVQVQYKDPKTGVETIVWMHKRNLAVLR